MEGGETRFAHVRRWQHALQQEGWWHSFELPDGSVINGVNTLEGMRGRLRNFPIPDDLTGKRVLDVGAWDGWFSFELERRGADVMAIDVFDNPRFRKMHEVYRSRVDYRRMDIYEVTPARVGFFDVVLFMGVLYHLKHPLLALERVCGVCKELAAVDSFVLQARFADGLPIERPILEFFEKDELGGQTDNWCAPSVACLLAFCRTAGFARAELKTISDFGAAVACHRTWEPLESEASEAPHLLGVAHHLHYGVNFDSTKDDYVVVWFHATEKDLCVDDLKPEVDGLGVGPIQLRFNDGVWEAAFRLPPGLESGWHDVSVRVRSSQRSDVQRIAVDVPFEVDTIHVDGLRDGASWEEGRLQRAQGDVLSIWIQGLPDNSDSHLVRILIDDSPALVEYIAARDRESRQINLRVPKEVPDGRRRLTIHAGRATAQREFDIVTD